MVNKQYIEKGVKNKIISLIKTIKPCDKSIKIKFKRWDFSRKLVAMICKIQGLKFSYVCFSSHVNFFHIEADTSIVSTLQSILFIIDKEAGKARFFNTRRDNIVEGLINEFLPDANDELSHDEYAEFCCPKCESKDFIKKGVSDTMRQQFKCRSCGKGYNAKTSLRCNQLHL